MDSNLQELQIQMVQLVAEHQGLKFKDSKAVENFFKGGEKPANKEDVDNVIKALKMICFVMTKFVCPIVEKL